MIAVDTNILVYAHRLEPPFHQKALAAIKDLSEGPSEWAVPWPCIHEFLAVVTNARIYRDPSTISVALNQISLWQESPTLVFLSEPNNYWDVFEKMSVNAKVVGPKIHDARIASICLAHDVKTLWTADRDFQRFPEIKAVNPLV